VIAVLATLCACAGNKQAPEKQASQPPSSQGTYKPTGSHIVEKTDGRRSPKNSSSSPVQDLSKSPAATIIPNQPPK
jgi:hypothetical protein